MSRLLDDDDPVVRDSAAAAIIHSHPDAPMVLTRALHDENYLARVVAVRALGRKVGPIARRDIRHALDDSVGAVRAAAVTALAGMAEAADRARFVTLATTTSDPLVEAAVLPAMIGTKSFFAVAHAFLEDSRPEVASAAFDALAAAGDLDALRPLASGPNPRLAVKASLLFKDFDKLRSLILYPEPSGIRSRPRTRRW